MADVNGPIDVNVSFAEQKGVLTCRTRDIGVEFTEEDKRQQVVRAFYDGLNFPVIAYLSQNRLWYLGSDDSLVDFINSFSEQFDKTVELSDPEVATLSPAKFKDQRIISSLLNKELACVFAGRAFSIDHHMRIAYSTASTDTPEKAPLIHEGRFFECMKYRVITLPEGVTLQMDSAIRVLVPKAHMDVGECLLTTCLEAECPRFKECNLTLPKSVVLYQGDEPVETVDCPDFRTASKVYNPWTAQTTMVPKKALLGRVSETSLRNRARNYSLKSSRARWEMISRLFGMICTNGALELSTDSGTLVFSSPFRQIPIATASTNPYAGYAKAGEVPLCFGTDMHEVDPYLGLMNLGTYSMNKMDPNIPNPDIRVFAIYPDRVGLRVRDLLQRLKTGHYSFPGFQANHKPFGVNLEYLESPVQWSDNESYIEIVQARMENLRIDNPARAGDVWIVVIPEGEEDLYFQIKNFATVRNLRTQMIDEGSIDSLRQQWYNTLCLALDIYTKAGAIPWRIDSSYFDQANCYIGLAFSRRHTEKDGQRFFLGVADVFDSLGEHLSFALHEGPVNAEIKGLHVDREFMKHLVIESIARYRDKMEESPQVILIHKPAPFLKEEVAGVADALLEKGSERALLVHVQHNSLFRAFNPSLDFQPVATTYFRIGPGNVVVFPTGYLSSTKVHKMGSPKPVQLNARWVEGSGIASNNLSNNELHFVIQNYLAFTRLRWSSLSPRIWDPVTLYAPRIVAEWQGMGVQGLDGLDIRDIM